MIQRLQHCCAVFGLFSSLRILTKQLPRVGVSFTQTRLSGPTPTAGVSHYQRSQRLCRSRNRTLDGQNGTKRLLELKMLCKTMVMPPRAQITIAQLSNDFDSMHESRYGMSCPGNTSIACTDDPDTGNLTWTNTLSTTTTFFYIIDGRSSSSQGNFMISWSTTGVVCMPLTDTGPRCVADLLVTQ